MSDALAQPWTAERFLDWVATQEDRYEYDGIAPVDMNGSTANHNRIAIRLLSLLDTQLRGSAFQVFGLAAGLRIGQSVRYPDALVTGTRQPGPTRIINDVRIVFEVLSPSTSRTDRFTKAREYAAVPSILRYALVEGRYAGVTVLHRSAGTDPWTSLSLTRDDLVALPDLGLSFAVADLYDEAEFPPEA